MPSFNQAAYIEGAIKSVISQDYDNFELIVIDGGSTDGAVDIIRQYEGKLAYWVSEPDSGQSDALNKGFARATGEIFGWLNSDDLYLPGAFEQAAKAFDRHPEKCVVFGDWLSIDSDDHVIEQHYAFDFNLNHFKYEGFHLNAQSMFWQRDVHRRFGIFDADLHNTMDYQMILAFGINEGNAAFLRLPVVLGAFRRYDTQKTGNFADRVVREHHRMAVQYGYFDKYGSTGALKRLAFRFRRAYWYLRRGGIGLLVKRLREAYAPVRPG